MTTATPTASTRISLILIQDLLESEQEVPCFVARSAGVTTSITRTRAIPVDALSASLDQGVRVPHLHPSRGTASTGLAADPVRTVPTRGTSRPLASGSRVGHGETTRTVTEAFCLDDAVPRFPRRGGPPLEVVTPLKRLAAGVRQSVGPGCEDAPGSGSLLQGSCGGTGLAALERALRGTRSGRWGT